jgi:hypothetical protein
MKSVFRMATAVALASVGLSGCGTVTQGVSQNITVTTSPPGAQCELSRDGGHLATLYSTPETVHVHKSGDDMVLTCSKRGYETASTVLESGYGIGVFGNAIVGGLVGAAIDVYDGAAYKYPGSAAVQFTPAKIDPASVAPVAVRSLCTPEDLELARAAQENHYSVRMMCD